MFAEYLRADTHENGSARDFGVTAEGLPRAPTHREPGEADEKGDDSYDERGRPRGFADAGKGLPLCLANQLVDALQHFPVLLLPV